MASERGRLLVADDEPDVHVFVKAALEEDEYEILTASDGNAALEMVRQESPDLVILDVQMPGMGGFDVFNELRRDEATRAIPVIMLTGVSKAVGMSFSGQDMGDFYGSEPEAFIDKPVDPQILRETVARLIQPASRA